MSYMEQSNFWMERSDFDYGANWLWLKQSDWGKMTMGWIDRNSSIDKGLFSHRCVGVTLDLDRAISYV